MLKESMDGAVGVIQKWFEKKFKVTLGIHCGITYIWVKVKL
jgi:hypothetical protein